MPYKLEGEQGVMLGWNMMKQMRFKFKFFNNGFNCKEESDEQYFARLEHQAAQLNVAVTKFNPGFICLQECPENEASYEHFKSAINQQSILKYHYEIKRLVNKQSLITLYDNRAYEINYELTAQMSNVILTDGMLDAVDPIVFRVRETKENRLAINVHALFSKDIENDVMEIHQAALKLGIKNIVFIGDFNRDMVLKSDADDCHKDISASLNEDHIFKERLHVKALRDTSFCSSFSRNSKTEQLLETRDGVMSTRPLSVISLPEIGMANTALSFTKKVSDTLRSMPDNFLANIEKFNQAQLEATNTSSVNMTVNY